MRAGALVGLIISGGALGLYSCAGPTAVEVSVFSEVPCATGADVALSVASDAPSLDQALTSATATRCEDMGDGTVRRGSIVLLPNADKERSIAFQLTTRNDERPVDDCAVDRSRCIVARRQLRFLTQRTIAVRVDLRLSCVGIVCASTETCVKGTCVSAQLPECENCDEPLPGPVLASGVDGGGSRPDVGAPSAEAGIDAGTEINGGLSWGGWTKRGNAQDPGIYAGQERTTDFDVYYTSFRLLAGAVAAGADRGNAPEDLSVSDWRGGDLIVGIGVKWKNGQAGPTVGGIGRFSYAKFDRDATGNFAPSTSVAPVPGNGVTDENNGGTGYIEFNAVNYNANPRGSVTDWRMRLPSGQLVIPTTVAGLPSNNFLNASRDFWDQTFGATTEELYKFKRALPFRTYGVANADLTIDSYQWLINSSAFDRAGLANSAPFQSFKAGWGFALTIANTADEYTDVVGLNLPLSQ